MITDFHTTTGISGILNHAERSGPLVMVLGIRPDIIRASIILRELRSKLGENFKLIWSGQHYSDNLKDIFFRELEVAPPDVELQISGSTDAELVSSMILSLSSTLIDLNPAAVIFLGDTNTVTGTLAAAQLNIPIVHIEGCMRSYDWRMPEEKYRTMADHLSDYIYAYLDVYKLQGIAEGIPGENIIVTGNPIVDVLHEHFLSGKLRLTQDELDNLLSEKYLVNSKDYYLMTCHRRENVENRNSLFNIMALAEKLEKKVLFPAGYRTQKQLSLFDIPIPKNVQMFDPVGYLELLELILSSKGVLSDSGTVVEETAVLGIPTIQMRKSTERPQVYEFGSAVKFDPAGGYSVEDVILRFRSIIPNSWKHTFGDGKASYRISKDLVRKFQDSDFHGHQMEKFLPFSTSSFRD